MIISEKVRSKCVKLKISLDRYEKEFQSLSTLGFSEKQINKLVLRRWSKNTVNTLISNFKSLQQLDRDAMTHDVITSMATHNGGGKCLNALLKSFKALKVQPYELTTSQIIRVVSHGGGSHNIEAVKNSFEELRNLNLSAEQIVKIVIHNGGSKNIETVKNSFKELKNLNFSTEQIVKIEIL